MVVLHGHPVVITCPVALQGSQERQKKIWRATRGRQLEAGVIPHMKTRAKDGGLKNNNGGIAEVEEGSGETLENRVVGGQMLQRIKGQVGGRGLKEGRQGVGEDSVVGEETGDRETLHLEVGVEMGEAEVETNLMRDLPGVIWTKGDVREEDGEMGVEANLTRTGGVLSPTQQHRYQTAKWHQ